MREPDPRQIGALIALVEQGRLREAENAAQGLLARHAEAGILWKILGVVQLRQGRDALPALRRCVQLMPHDAEAHGNLGDALYDENRFAEALPNFERSLRLRPNDPDALLKAGECLRALGRVREAVPLYERACALAPATAAAHNDLGNALLELGRHAEAAGRYLQALELEPDNASIHCNLGLVLRHLGRWDESLARIERAIALDPTLAPAHNLRGLLLQRLGRREEAIDSFHRTLAIDQNHVEALNNLGIAMRQIGRRREAAELHRRAIEIDPGRADSHGNLGAALLDMRRIEEAVSSLERALALDPDLLAARVTLATALRALGRGADAEIHGQAVLAADPDHADALSLLGELAADRGSFTDAEALFRRALARDPAAIPAWCGIAAHRRMTREDADWLHGVLRQLADRPPLAEEISLRYALGKYHDDTGQYNTAFEHYRIANELSKRFGARYDRAAYDARLEQSIASAAAASSTARPPASASEVPVLVIGMPRSGTSLAEQILASHPAVFGAGEIRFWDDVEAGYRAARRDGLNGGEVLTTAALDYLERLTRDAPAAARVIDKMPANFLYAGLIHSVLPRARIIHMRRHPIDTCLSIYRQNFFNMGPYANDLDDLAHYYRGYLRITDHWRRTLPPSALLEVPYEALVADPQSWIRRMLDFLGLPFDARCLEFHRTPRVVLTASKWQVRQPIHTASAGRWRNYEQFIGPLKSLLTGYTAA